MNILIYHVLTKQIVHCPVIFVTEFKFSNRWIVIYEQRRHVAQVRSFITFLHIYVLKLK